MKISNEILAKYTNIDSIDRLRNLQEIHNSTVLDEGFDDLLSELSNDIKLEEINLSLSSDLDSAETIFKNEDDLRELNQHEIIPNYERLLKRLPTSSVKKLTLCLSWDELNENLFNSKSMFKLLVTLLDKEWPALEVFEFSHIGQVSSATYQTSDVFVVIMEFLRKLPHPEKLKKLNLDLTEIPTYNYNGNVLDLRETSVDFYQQEPPLKYELRGLIASLNYLSNLTEFSFSGNFVSLLVQDEIGAWIKNHPCLKAVAVVFNTTGANLLAFNDIVMNQNLRSVTLGADDMFLSTIPLGVDLNEYPGCYIQPNINKESQVAHFFTTISNNRGLRSLSLNFSLYNLFHDPEDTQANDIFTTEHGQELIRQRVFIPLFQNKTLKYLSLQYHENLFTPQDFSFFAKLNKNIVDLEIKNLDRCRDQSLRINVSKFNFFNRQTENIILAPFKKISRECIIARKADLRSKAIIESKNPKEALDLINRIDKYTFYNFLPSLLDVALDRDLSEEIILIQNQFTISIVSVLLSSANVGSDISRKIISYLSDPKDFESLFLATGGLFFKSPSVKNLISSINNGKRKANVNYQEDTEQEDIEQDEGRLNKRARYNK